MDTMDNKLLKFHPHTEMTVRKIYNLEKPEDMDRAIDALEEWLKKQHHLTKRDYPRDYLKRSIIFMKGSVERSKAQIDTLCSMRTLFPKYFEKYDARNDFEGMDSILVDAILPKLTEDNYRVYVAHFQRDGATNQILLDGLRFGILKMEYLKAHDCCNGFVGILDYRNITLVDFMSMLDFVMIQQYIKLIKAGYGMRIKALHSITTSTAIELLIKIVKPMFGPKVYTRLLVHTSVETLYEHVPRDILPPELGGYEESIVSLSDKWKNVLGTKENVNYMKEMSEAVSNEAYRMKGKLNELDLGIAGTFRSLSVD